MIQLIRKFPFFKLVEVQTPPNFDTVIVNAEELTPEQKLKIKEAKNLLITNNIPINKVRFIFDRTFDYDIDKDVVNPKYVVMHPRKWRRHKYMLELKKPENLMNIMIGIYQTDHDNYQFVREFIKKSKRGVVIMLNMAHPIDSLNYNILMASLDNAADHYFLQQEVTKKYS